MAWRQDEDVTERRREPVLIDRERSAAPPPTALAPTPALAPERDEMPALDKDQRALVEAQWALVERAFRRDLVRSEDRQPPRAAAPEPAREPGALFEPPEVKPPSDFVQTVQSRQTIEPVVGDTPSAPRAQPETRSRWFGGPSVEEQKRIVKPKWFGASASGAAQRRGVMLMSLVAIACATAALAFWRLDRQFDRVATQPAALAPPAPVAAPAAPAKAPRTASTASAQSASAQPGSAQAARKPATPRPAAQASPPATAEAEADSARSAAEAPVAARPQDRADTDPSAVAPWRTNSTQRADTAPPRSTPPAWQREERRRNAYRPGREAPYVAAPSPRPETVEEASGPSPAPLPYYPRASARRNGETGTGSDMPAGMAAPLPYGGPEAGYRAGGR